MQQGQKDQKTIIQEKAQLLTSAAEHHSTPNIVTERDAWVAFLQMVDTANFDCPIVDAKIFSDPGILEIISLEAKVLCSGNPCRHVPSPR